AHVNVAADDAIRRRAPGALGGRGQPLLTEQLDGLLLVAFRLGEGRLALHHAGAGLLAQALHLIRCNRRSRHYRAPVRGTGPKSHRRWGLSPKLEMCAKSEKTAYMTRAGGDEPGPARKFQPNDGSAWSRLKRARA